MGKIIIMVVLYLLSLGVLIAYSIIVYYKTPEKKLGPLTSIAVVTTDLIIFYLMNCRLVKGPMHTSILLVGFRACLFGFGGDYWFLGYCLLYFILVVYLGY